MKQAAQWRLQQWSALAADTEPKIHRHRNQLFELNAQASTALPALSQSALGLQIEDTDCKISYARVKAQV